MLRKYLAAIAALATLALLASTMPSSITTATELKAKQKKQRLLLPAVQKIREAGRRSQQTKQGGLKQQRSKAGQPHVKVFDGRTGQ